MILVKLQGGLGNQMFQYAFGKALSLEHNSALYVDTSFLNNCCGTDAGFTSRQYELKVFKTDIKTASADLVKTFEKKSVFKKITSSLGLPIKKIYSETRTEIAGQLKLINPPVQLIGYWQSEHYFKKYAVEIKNEFEFNAASDISSVNLLAKIQACNSVSVHIRRGDYVTNPVASDVLGVLEKKYYLDAMDLINTKINNPFYFFFSDDTAWVKQNFNQVQNSIIVEKSAHSADYMDMYLMSKCRHNIIANSSFSWWGAWLNSNQNKIVIAPRLWNKNDSHSNPDLIPPGWLVI